MSLIEMSDNDWDECYLRYYFLWHYAGISPKHKKYILNWREKQGWK